MFDKIVIKSHLKDYDVEFINDAAEHLQTTLSENSIIVIDTMVFDLYEKSFAPLLEKFRFVKITCNESNKTLNYCQEVIRILLEKNVRKTDVLVAVGGGITQDIVTFISSIIFRGIQWSFYPTTLLAQADSCIGSKSSINFDQYKNLIGTFNPPNHIYISVKFLYTLSESEVRSGIGEMMHYFLNDGTIDAKEIMSKYDVLLIDRAQIIPFISKSLNIKKKIIEIDEFDTEIRHIFNYGHTFGHAIEAVSNYDIPHGQAITLGMDIANYFSLKLNMIDQEIFNELHLLLEKNIPDFVIDQRNLDIYCQALAKDKKNLGGKVGCILTNGPGKMKKCFLEMDTWFKNELLAYFKYRQTYAESN
jgi:3-dehydroquinate synthase